MQINKRLLCLLWSANMDWRMTQLILLGMH
jgi:hypothetical protein